MSIDEWRKLHKLSSEVTTQGQGGAGVLLRENRMLSNHLLIVVVARCLDLADKAVNKPGAPVGDKDRRRVPRSSRPSKKG